MFLGDAAVKCAAAACKEYCPRLVLNRVVVCLGALLFAAAPVTWPQAAPGPAVPPPVAGQAPAPAQAPQTIESINFDGNRKYPQQTLQTRIFWPVQATLIARAESAQTTWRLWNTGYFDDITLEVQDNPAKPNSIIIIFHVKERPTISFIDYVGVKSATKSDILDRFKERKVGLTIESQLDPTKVRRGEVVLQELLAEHGRQFAIVKGGIETHPGHQPRPADFQRGRRTQGQGRRHPVYGQYGFLAAQDRSLHAHVPAVCDPHVAVRCPADVQDV